jgi:hypothetical protein
VVDRRSGRGSPAFPVNARSYGAFSDPQDTGGLLYSDAVRPFHNGRVRTLYLRFDVYLSMTVRACYELERKSHRNADFRVSLVPSRSLFPAFLSRF